MDVSSPFNIIDVDTVDPMSGHALRIREACRWCSIQVTDRCHCGSDAACGGSIRGHWGRSRAALKSNRFMGSLWLAVARSCIRPARGRACDVLWRAFGHRDSFCLSTPGGLTGMPPWRLQLAIDEVLDPMRTSFWPLA